MAKGFHFVDGLQDDRHAKRLKRRWVMIGKNVGKRYARRSRIEKPSINARNLAVCSPFVNTFRDQLIPFPLPWEVPPATLECIHNFFTSTADRLYPLQLGISMHDAKLMWLRVLFTDEAAFHCNVALMHACNDILWSGGGSPVKALYHLSQTFAQMQKRLDSEQALSDSTIGIVLSLAHQEHIRRQHEDAALHMKGLERMIELRGGLTQLEGNTALVLKICKTDIMLALRHGSPTIYFRDRLSSVQSLLALNGVCFSRIAPVSMRQRHQMDSYLFTIFADVMSISSLFNNHLHSFKFTIDMLQEITASICYRLLRYRTLGDTNPQSGLDAAYHIGLVAMMMTIFLRHDHRRIASYDLIPLRLRDALESPIKGLEHSLMLWLSIVGGIWVSDDHDRQWLALRIRTNAERLGVGTWDDARKLIKEYPWIDVLHDQPGLQLWDHAFHG